MKNPSEFPLYIYVGKSNDKDMQLIAKFPNASWVPRLNERLVLPKGERRRAAEWLLVRVELVVHDLVRQVVNVSCEEIKSGSIDYKKQDLDTLIERFEAANLEDFDEEFERLRYCR